VSETHGTVNERRLSGAGLVLGFVFILAGALSFTADEGRIDPAFAALPKGNLLSLGMVATALGLALLESQLRDAGERVLSRAGLVAFLFAAGLWLVAEAISMDGGSWVYPLERDYVLLSCFSMACYGGALLRTRLLSRWIGWFGVAWGVIWLGVALLTFIPPLTPNLVPLVVGIALLVTPLGRWTSRPTP
jgi:hypothetical protein